MFGRAVAALRRPRLGPALTAALHLAALALFTHGFLLTRVHLEERSTAAHAGTDNASSGGVGYGAANSSSTQGAPFNRVVWLMIDALRYDFVISDGRYTCPGASTLQQQQQQGLCHQGHMPYLAGLARQTAARSFMFIADAPTTTTQRLKSLATGGLPSFFDVSNSFTAGSVTDDNLLDQLAAAGRRMAFLGDTTWQQLFPRQWAWSRPYPCFNVRDLHTVDDGVWQHLLPALRKPGGAPPGGGGTGEEGLGWDGLLVAHYLGVDHCGHTHGVGSSEMAAKLRQMDSHVQQVVEALLEQAGPGGAYERTLLLVSGDHGQTLGGDHGGGSPEEVDSALVAVDIGGLHASMHSRDTAGVAGAGGLAAPAPCRANCSCGVERNQCAPDLPQMDLTPTLSALLGVPIPFGNMGKLSAELWQLTARMHSPATGDGAREGSGSGAAASAAAAAESTAAAAPAPAGTGGASWEHSLAGVLLANAQQVHRYLNTYAATAGASFSRTALAGLNAQFGGLEQPPAKDASVLVDRCYAYLEAAASVAREQWTQFADLPMLAGVVLFAATLLLQAVAAFGGSQAGGGDAAPPQRPAGWLAPVLQQLLGWQLLAPLGRWQLRVPAFRAWLAAAALVHGLGIFSFFYLLSEGKMVCFLVAGACAALALAAGRASRAAGKGVRGVVGLAVMSLRFNVLMLVLGVTHHTGQGFWTRLTVHEPQPAGDLERGWHGKLGKMKAFAVKLMAAAGIDQLSPAVLLVAQHSLLCTLPILVLAAATERLQRGSRQRGTVQRLLQLAAFASVAAYHQVEDAIKHGLLPAGATLDHLAAHHVLPHLPTELASWVEQAVAVAVRPVLAAWPGAAQLSSHLLALPLSTLLPHATYALCGALAALWLLQAATRRVHGPPAAAAAAQVLLAAVLQVSDRQAPLILLLALLELTAVAKLLARRAELQPAGSSGGGVAGEAGALLALVAAQLFFVTGHLCEFAGLQYTAGFVGFEEFHLWRSGSLLLLNTYGGTVLALLALPAVVQYVHAAAAAAATAAPDGSNGSSTAGQSQPKAGAAEGSAQQSFAAAQRKAVAVSGLVCAFGAFCATLSAGVQRRHLYAWALFAPRFVFAAVMLGLTDIVLILLSLTA